MDMIKFEEKGFFELFAELNKSYETDLYVVDIGSYYGIYYYIGGYDAEKQIVLSTARGEDRKFKALDSIYKLVKKYKLKSVTFKII
jgi:hypothetical protein